MVFLAPPFVDVGGHDTCGFDSFQGKDNGGVIGDGEGSTTGKVLGVLDASPKGGNVVVRVPGRLHGFAVAFEVFGRFLPYVSIK